MEGNGKVRRFFSAFANDGEAKDTPAIRRTAPADWAPLAKAVHAFAQERQIPFIADMNADFRDGYGAVPMSNWPMQRASASICYLTADVRRRANLSVVCNALVIGLLFDGRRAVGVRVRVGGEDKDFFAGEIIVALGGVHSPAFLMRAGLGPATALRSKWRKRRAKRTSSCSG